MPPDQPTWRPYDVPGDEPGERIQPDGVPLAKKKPSEQKKQPQQQPRKQQLPPDVAAGASVGLGVSGLVIAVVTTAIIAACGIGILAFVRSGAIGSPDMHSEAGVQEMIDEVEEETGTTEVFSANFYPDYAALDVHVEGGDGLRYDSYRYDGGLDDLDFSSTATEGDETFDLNEIDGSLFAGFCEQVTELLDEADECYIIVRAPSADDVEPYFYSAHTSNDYESAWIDFDVDGEKVRGSDDL